jgi:hypothetical protein
MTLGDCGLRDGVARGRGDGKRAEMVGNEPFGDSTDGQPEQITDEQRDQRRRERAGGGVIHSEAGNDGDHKGAEAEGRRDESGKTEVHEGDNSGGGHASAGTPR